MAPRMPNMSRRVRVDVAIAGAGLTGLALAVALARQGAAVAVIECQTLDRLVEPEHDGRVTAIALGTKRFLDDLGVWPEMAPTAEPIRDIVVTEAGLPLAVHYDHHEIGAEPLGWIVPNRAIRLAHYRALKLLPQIQLVTPARIVGLAQRSSTIELELDRGQRLSSSLLAICEGRHSPTRDIAGIRSTAKPYGQTGIVGTLRHEKPHHGFAVERFYPDGPFAVLPMRGNRSSIVWALEEARAEAIKRTSDDEFALEVDERFGDILGHSEIEDRRWYYPLVLVTTERLTADRIALVGDSAHGVHPIAGQGWNLAARDVAALAQIVTERLNLGLDPGDALALERYAAWRRFDTLALTTVTDAITRVFSNETSSLKLLRNFGLGLVDRLPPAKRFFMRHAMGLLGELPRAMQPR